MKILIFCAHPDDLEFEIPSILISAAGKPKIKGLNLDSGKVKSILLKGKKFLVKSDENEKIELKIASMTRGEMSSFTNITKSTKKAAQIRTKELNESQEIITGQKPDFLGFFDGYVKVDEETVSFVQNYILKLQPDIIIAPEPIYTWYHHRDHIKTGKIVFLALKRIKNNNMNSGTLEKIPSLYYFQAIWNDWYFPRYKKFKKIINRALKAHRSQSGLLRFAKLPGFIETLIHGIKIPETLFAEALRHQPIPDRNGDVGNFRIKKLEDLGLAKRIVYYFSKRSFSMGIEDYENRAKNMDGTLDPTISEDW